MQYSVQYNTGDEVRCRCHNMSTKINVILYCVTVRVCVHNYTIQYNIIFYAWSISIPRSLVAGNPCVREKRLVCDIFSFDISSHHRCSRFEYRYPAEYSSWQNALFLVFFSTRRRRWVGDYPPSSCVREERRGCPGSDPTELSQTRDRHSVVSCHSSTF